MYTYFISYRVSATTMKRAHFGNCVMNCNEPIETVERVRELEEEIKFIKEKVNTKTGKVKILNIVLLKKD